MLELIREHESLFAKVPPSISARTPGGSRASPSALRQPHLHPSPCLRQLSLPLITERSREPGQPAADGQKTRYNTPALTKLQHTNVSQSHTLSGSFQVPPKQVGPEPHDHLSTIKTWKEDRLHSHTKGKTQVHHSHKGKIGRCTSHTEKERNKSTIHTEGEETGVPFTQRGWREGNQSCRDLSKTHLINNFIFYLPHFYHFHPSSVPTTTLGQ